MSNVTKIPSKSPARGLGKGLSALMSDVYSPAAAATAKQSISVETPAAGNPQSLPLSAIRPGKFQPRDHFEPAALAELAESIRKNGVVQPIIVRRLGEGLHEIIAGERRWRAANMTGLQEIPVIIRDYDDKKALEIALIENVQREDLSPLEEAVGFQRLMQEFDYTQEQLGSALHKSRSHIANMLRLLELPEAIRQLLSESKISIGHARALSGVPDAVALAHQIVEKGLNVRQAEKLARLGKGKEEVSRPRKPRAHQQPVDGTRKEFMPAYQAQRDPDILALEETLSENLGLKVSIQDQGQSGAITIAYTSLEQLDDVLRRLGGGV